jgi:predicted DNA-binding transcriptional regulator AlpA
MSDDESELKHDQTPIFEKLVVKSAGGGYRVYASNPARAFARLPKTALLDTADLCLLFGCSTRSIYRWMAEQDLRWDLKVGREYLFRKEDVVDWYADNRPRLGRPRRRER